VTAGDDAARLGAQVLAYGDRAVVVDLALPPGPRTSRLVHDLADHLRDFLGQPAHLGWEPPVAAATSVLVPVDPVEPGVEVALVGVHAAIRAWRPNESAVHAGGSEAIVVPVRYGGADGPDLEEVAAVTGLTPDEVIAVHSAVDYEVAFLGFAPGFAYLGPLDPSLTLPRRSSPRARVPAGSVAIGGPQTAIYPGEGPGGWWLIGRTDLPVWDPTREPAALFRPGLRVRFRTVEGTDPATSV